jgi:hypothetical protein
MWTVLGAGAGEKRRRAKLVGPAGEESCAGGQGSRARCSGPWTGDHDTGPLIVGCFAARQEGILLFSRDWREGGAACGLRVSWLRGMRDCIGRRKLWEGVITK